ncbi:MAG: aminotransferase class V-fold PLP-dependent enzyme [Rhodobacter sp.]|jgi:isopenicillin-N epimerase|nr:aminotransferase class V-fold PLP-dependent enzyme [Rhodobacter sp.]MCE2748998.1 aminotransferase class V-fold PLP-dependent enzyme [Rhodobacter sp.]
MGQNLAAQFLLDPEVTFLNHGSFGACPRPVFEEYQRWQLKLERQPVAFLDPNRGLSGWMREAREALAEVVGADPNDIVGQTNATAALNIVAQSLDLRPGDEILTTDHEYAALEKTWAYVCRRTGAQVKVVSIPLPLTREEQFTDALFTGLTDRTRAVFLSHITSATALVFPIGRIVAKARACGIWTVIDGAHTPGHIPLDLNALGADFYAGNCHKWMMSPKGAGFLHVRRALQPMLNPLVISHGWTGDGNQPGAQGPFGNSSFIDMLEMQGTRDPSAWLTVPAALAFTRQHDWDTVARDCQALVQHTAMRVAALTGLPSFSSPEFCAPQMVSMPVPGCDPLVLQRSLMEHYGIEIPCFTWKAHTIVRISAQGYNTAQQMDHLVAALSDLLPKLSAQA